MDIGKEIREVEFEPVSMPGSDPVQVPVPSVPAGEPVPHEPAPDEEPAHAR